MRTELQAYGTALINSYERRCEFNTPLRFTLKEVIKDISLMIDYVMDLQEDVCKSTLELNADLRNDARAYQEDLAEKECTITTLAMNLGGLGYIEQENMMLEADNLKLNNQLALQETKRKELFKECWEAEIENGKYIMEIQDLKTDNQMWQAKCIELREKIEKLTGPHWVD